ncbi:hypothetical protein V1522DRAFT_399176 [Lipomyces starkeyi]
MIQLLKGAEDNLVTHLRQGIEDLAPERLRVFRIEEIREMLETTQRYAMKPHKLVIGLIVGLPVLTSHIPPEYKPFPPLPWVMERFLLPLLSMWHRGYWKYSPDACY